MKGRIVVYNKRLIALIVFCVVCFSLAVGRVYRYQIADGGYYLSLAEKSNYTTVKITAARGEIVDRNGVPFTRNRASFNVEFDYSYLQKRQENQVIFSLIKTFEALDETWIDNLPITYEKPYEFLPDRETDVARMKKKLELNDWATAQNCMDALFEWNDGRNTSDPRYKEGQRGIEYLDFTEEYRRKIAGVRYEMLAKDFSAYTPRYTFATDISTTTVTLLKELSADFVGVEVAEKPIRTYVGGDVASHIIGTIGPIYAEEYEYYKNLPDSDYSMNDTVGKSGIEKAYERELRGKSGELQVIKNAQGQIVDMIETVPPVAGKTVQLTIDYNFQAEVQKILSDFIQWMDKTNSQDKIAEGAAIVVLDTRTNGVLASISYPYYDLHTYYTDYNTVLNGENLPLTNRALNGLYRPGSTFKPVVAAAALSEGLISGSSTVFCDGAYHFYQGWSPSCLQIGHSHQHMTVNTALKWSCNVFFYDVGRQLGIDPMNRYANLFGLGAPTGLDIPSSVGYLSSPENSKRLGTTWQNGHVVQAAIGQLDTLVSPLQMALEASTLANHGTRYNAHFLHRLLSYDRTAELSRYTPSVAASYDMPDAVFAEVAGGMIAAGSTVSAPYNLTDLPYQVAVKTGTPQVSPTKTNNAFIAFAPVDEPEIAISCMIENGISANLLVRPILEAYERSVARAADPTADLTQPLVPDPDTLLFPYQRPAAPAETESQPTPGN